MNKNLVMPEEFIVKEISLLKTIESEIVNSKSKKDALDRVSGWISVLEGLENAVHCLQQPVVLQPLNPDQ